MKFKTVMIIKAIACLVFGPLLLLVPEWSLNILGTTLGSGTTLTAREYGAALIGTLVLTWLVRNAEDSITRRAIIWSLFICDAIALVATLIIQLSGGLNSLGWGIVALYLFLTLCLGYLLFSKGETA